MAGEIKMDIGLFGVLKQSDMVQNANKALSDGDEGSHFCLKSWGQSRAGRKKDSVSPSKSTWW